MPAGPEPAADLCADVLVVGAARLADRPLTYRVPPALRPFAAPGMRAVVPLGARRVLGFVLAVRPCDPPDGVSRGARGPVPPGGHVQVMRDVIDLPDDAPMFPETLIALAREVAGETLSSLRAAVECLVPPEVFRQPPPARLRTVVREAAQPVPLRLGRRQAAMLAAVSAAPSGLPAADLVRGGGGPVLRRLAAAGLVRVLDAPRLPADRLSADRPPIPRRATMEQAPATMNSRPLNGVEPSRPDREARGALPDALLLGDAETRWAWIANAVAAVVRDGGRALVLVPEIADAPAAAERLGRAGTVAVLHSGLAPRDRRAVWDRIRAGAAAVVVGTRSALFAPLARLRMIVVDDEQSEAYKSDAAPRYHARDVAARRARLEDARLVLASAAPSVETYAAAGAGTLATIRLPAARRGPRVTVVDMRAERRRGHVGYLSRDLMQAITRHLRARGTVALVVPQTGYARILLCRECGAAVRCPACDIAMAYDREEGTIRCRVCGRSGRAPDVCPRCRGVGLRGVGAGTKRIEEVVRRLFPALRIARLDAETGRDAARVARDFAAGRIRLLVGTVMLLRAHRARPTLAGVVDADGTLYLPDFRAAERTLQRLRAAAELPAGGPGAGPPAEIVLQTRVPEHPVMQAIAGGRDAGFYDAELALRREFGYPPSSRLVRVVAEAAAPAAARALADRVAAAGRAHGLDVLGPAALRGSDGRRVQAVLRAEDPAAARDGARAVLAETPAPRGARLVVDVDPLDLA